MKSYLSLVFSFSLVLAAPNVSYSSGGASAAHMARLKSLVGASASGSYASQHFACCSPKSFGCCIKGVMGIMQLIQMLQGAQNSGMSAEALINGAYDEFAFDPTTAGFCTGGDSTCTPDAIDTNLSGFDQPFKTGVGYDDAISDMKQSALDQLATAEKLGFKVDAENGTITDPNGKVTNMSDIKTNLPSGLSKNASDKMAGLDKALNSKTSGNRAVASVGGAGGIVFKDEFVGGGLGGLNKKKKDGQDTKEFLAGLSDKDAKNGGVGFAGDNIFSMIQRRYSKKVTAKEFIGRNKK